MTDTGRATRDQRHEVDVAIVGAGFAGLYMLYRTRELGLSVRLFEAGSDVGGTWFWNRYPGARCDVDSVDYSYSFSARLEQEWTWRERYASQPEILDYLRHVAERFDLRRDIVFGARVQTAHYDDANDTWTLRTDIGIDAVARFCIMATGSLSVPKPPDLPGLDRFYGTIHHTAQWPESEVDFSGQRVGVFGTGASGVQVIPMLAERAAHVTVFQRTPSFSAPARNAPLDEEFVRSVKRNYPRRRRAARESSTALWADNPRSAWDVDDEARHQEYAARWAGGGFALLGAYQDLLVDRRANDTAADFVRGKIREIVEDPAVAEKLLPWSHPLGARRLCVDTGYFETYNRDDVTLVDLREEPLRTLTESGVRTRHDEHDLDSVVLATGFDAMTGALACIDIRGRAGRTLAEKWSSGPRTLLGLHTAGFPNLFMLAATGSPSVLTNMVMAIEQHVEWTAHCLRYLFSGGYRSIEATAEAELSWTDHVDDVAQATLLGRAESWYRGANVPGKRRVFLPYAGGFAEYARRCAEVADDGYAGFILK